MDDDVFISEYANALKNAKGTTGNLYAIGIFE
jgi:hypothetical protein